MEGLGHPGFERQSSQGRLLHSSPLDTLVCRTSSGRRTATRKQQTHTSPANTSIIVPPSLQPRCAPLQPSVYASVPPPRLPPDQRVPDSPLLHSNFRSSTASAVTNTTALHGSQNSKSDGGCYEENDNYGQQPQEASHNYDNGPSYPFVTPSATTHLDSQTDSWPQATGLVQPSTLNYSEIEDPMHPSTLPTVVVSSPQDDSPMLNGPMRQPIVSQSGSPRLNFSRPGRPPIVSSAEQKRQVLERNARRPNSPATNPTPLSLRAVTPVTGIYPDKLEMPGRLSPRELPGTSSASSSYLHPDGVYSSPSLASPNHVTLPSHPPALRAGSPISLYSNTYSFYQLDSAVPSPTSQSPQSSPDVSPATSRPASTESETPEEYLQLGIQYHEANRLRDSAVCFEKSAKEQGGCGVGMLMWGLTLRHGWGCEKNEKNGFMWLTRAAESAVQDLEKAKKGLDVKGVKVSCPFFVR